MSTRNNAQMTAGTTNHYPSTRSGTPGTACYDNIAAKCMLGSVLPAKRRDKLYTHNPPAKC